MDFHVNELEDVISFAKEGTSRGNDLINHSLLKLLPSIAIQKLLYIFNKIIKEASFPCMWQNYDLILLPKPNKSDFRPIVLS